MGRRCQPQAPGLDGRDELAFGHALHRPRPEGGLRDSHDRVRDVPALDRRRSACGRPSTARGLASSRSSRCRKHLLADGTLHLTFERPAERCELALSIEAVGTLAAEEVTISSRTRVPGVGHAFFLIVRSTDDLGS